MSQRLNFYFGNTPELRQMSVKAGQLQALQQQYELLVPPSLGRYSRVMQIEQRVLILAANNSAIAAKLRQLAPELARQLRDKGCEITGIQVKVQVVLPDFKHVSSPVTLSQEGRRRLAELSEELSDSPLKQALLRMLRNSASSSRT